MTDNTALRASALSTFSFQSSFSIRAILIDGTPWFVAKDVFTALGLTWKGSDSLSMIPQDWRGVRKLRTPLANQHGEHGEQEQEYILITEPAVYKIAFRSNKPEADAFTNRVAEIITEIRQTGRYQLAAPAYEKISDEQLKHLSEAMLKAFGGWIFQGSQSSIQHGYNKLRVDHSIAHIADLPAEEFEPAMARVREFDQMVRAFEHFVFEAKKEFLTTFIEGGAPWTLWLERKWKQQMQEALPARPDWLAIQQQLQAATQAPVLALD